MTYARLIGAAFTFLSFVIGITNAHSQNVVFPLKEPHQEPITIFIPGILGSKLSVNGRTIWGEIASFPDELFYDGIIADSQPLIYVTGFGLKIRRETYGDFFTEQLNTLSSNALFIPFSYDWRASNIVSATHFNTFICKVVKEHNRPIKIVAHSMGGIVLKHWLMNHYKPGCPSDQTLTPDIESILFVATPNYGVPKAFEYLVSGIQLINFPVIGNFISSGLNKHGVSFDSLYELLPFSHSYRSVFDRSNMCFPEGGRRFGAIALKYRIMYKKAVDDTAEIVDVFSDIVLERLGVLRKIQLLSGKFPSSIGDPRNYLKKKLSSAREAICSLANFQLPSELTGKVFYLAGRLANDKGIARGSTIDEIYITDYRLDDVTVQSIIADTITGINFYIYHNMAPGDLTVPLNIATGAKAENIKFRHVNAGHLEILNSYSFRNISEIMDNASLIDLSPAVSIASYIYSTRISQMNS